MFNTQRQIMYRLVFKNNRWFVRTDTGRLLGGFADKNAAVKLLQQLEMVAAE